MSVEESTPRERFINGTAAIIIQDYLFKMIDTLDSEHEYERLAGFIVQSRDAAEDILNQYDEMVEARVRDAFHAGWKGAGGMVIDDAEMEATRHE